MPVTLWSMPPQATRWHCGGVPPIPPMDSPASSLFPSQAGCPGCTLLLPQVSSLKTTVG